MKFFLLLGPKYSGKTTTGRELAKVLNVPFYDMDTLVEERTRQSIRELYRTGAALFQQEEAAALKTLFASGNSGVLAGGGGIIDNLSAMTLLKKEFANHCTIYLEVTAETAWQRIVSQGELPPFLEAATPEESKEKHRSLHIRRGKDYKKFAAYSVFADGKTPHELAEELCNLIQYNNL